MTLKCTWLWNGVAAQGSMFYGFSETWYTDLGPAALIPIMQTMARSRAVILPDGAFLYGFRVADTAPNSRAFTQISDFNIEGNPALSTVNVPNDAALCVVYGSTPGTRKQFWMHALPDTLVINAKDNLNVIGGATRAWLNVMGQNGFKFQHKIQTAPTGHVLSIDAAGNVLTQQAITGVAPRVNVQLLKVRGVDGRGKRGIFVVESVTSEFSFKLMHWPGDIVGQSGKIRLVQYGYSTLRPIPPGGPFNNPVVRMGTRKVGRPFGQLRGRVSAKR